MKRIITIIIVLGLVLPAFAVASRVATGSTRNALDRAAAPQLPPGISERCLLAQVTTKDGGNWAHRRLQRRPLSLVRPPGVQRCRHLAPCSRALGVRHGGFFSCSRADGSASPSRSGETCICHVADLTGMAR